MQKLMPFHWKKFLLVSIQLSYVRQSILRVLQMFLLKLLYYSPYVSCEVLYSIDYTYKSLVTDIPTCMLDQPRHVGFFFTAHLLCMISGSTLALFV